MKTSQAHTALLTLLENYHSHPGIGDLLQRLHSTQENILGVYQDSIPVLEEALWNTPFSEHNISLYQQTFRELESLISKEENESRFHFYIVIPVADRPLHLEQCLNSIFELCMHFRYGGMHEGCFNKVCVIIADDSMENQNIEKHKVLAQAFTKRGIQTTYFGLNQQLDTIGEISQEYRTQLISVLGDANQASFYHKGPSLTRNITYLKLNTISRQMKHVLFYFIDSDQEFNVTINTPDGDKKVFAINYLYHLNSIFSSSNVSILTGKVVGDPPVSPAVMAGNLLEDIYSFLKQLGETVPESPCQFHHNSAENSDDAAYHDMADLFGYQRARQAFRYACPIDRDHTHIASFSHFCANLHSFFYGEHPTRKSYFKYQHAFTTLHPARTIYTGNYIISPDALTFFIPFASIKLRMAGPVLGRVIKSEIQGKFVSANLPMLHKRTVHETGQSEFRPGIEAQDEHIELSGEFIRQYFGDVMLFSIEELTRQGYPANPLTEIQIQDCVHKTEKNLHRHYAEKHDEIIDKLNKIQRLVQDENQWWNLKNECSIPVKQLTTFLINIENNYGDRSPFYQLITDEKKKQSTLNEIVSEIIRYPEIRNIWERVLNR